MNSPLLQESCLNLLITLAQTPGPSLGEAPRRKVLEEFLSGHHVAYAVDGAGNLRVTLGDGPWEETVVFDAHLDVVQEGFEPRVARKEDRLIGMGVADNLAAVSLLAHLAADLSNLEAPLKRPLLVLFSTGEEGDGNLKGVRHLVEEKQTPPHLFAAFDLNFDHISLTALGSRRYRITVTAPGGHSWSDFGLPGAIDALMALFIEVRQKFDKATAHRPLEASCNIGSFTGGEGINSIAANASGTFEFRSVDPELLAQLDAILKEALAARTTDTVSFACATTGERPAAQPINRQALEPMAAEAIRSATGTAPTEIPMSTNINIPLAHGWPSVCMGLCQSGRFHSHEEFLITGSLKQGWNVLQTLIKQMEAPKKTI